MVKCLRVLETASTDPFRNLSVEEFLLRSVREGECILYLWQNEKTVVIGRNQNARAECRYLALEEDGGHLVRRLSGGGAVYHDLGNLNFTFLVTLSDYDVDRQTEVILRGVRKVGINAVRNGRNDLTADGGKFSGHAYYRSGEQCYHHGTIMLDVSMEPLEKYLNVSPLKLESRGIRSVRSRVVNLRSIRPDLTVDEMKAALTESFSEVYGLPVTRLDESSLPEADIAAGTARFADPAWRYGSETPREFSREAKFPWGLLRVDYDVSGGVITGADVWSDGLEADYISEISELLSGCPLEAASLRAALSHPGAAEEVEDAVVTLLTRNEENDEI